VWNWGNDMMGWGGSPGWGLFGLAHVLWWVLLVLGVAVLARWLFARGGRAAREGEDRALSILRERYARGEIDKAEFDARRRDLGQPS